MFKYRLAAIIAVLLVSFGTAGAAEKSFLITPAGVQDASFKSAYFQVRDMSLTAWDKGEGLVEVVFQYTLTRYNPGNKILNIMLTGLSQGGKPLWAMSVKPDMRYLQRNRPLPASETIYVQPGTFKKAVRVWLDFVDDSR